VLRLVLDVGRGSELCCVCKRLGALLTGLVGLLACNKVLVIGVGVKDVLEANSSSFVDRLESCN